MVDIGDQLVVGYICGDEDCVVFLYEVICFVYFVYVQIGVDFVLMFIVVVWLEVVLDVFVECFDCVCCDDVFWVVVDVDVYVGVCIVVCGVDFVGYIVVVYQMCVSVCIVDFLDQLFVLWMVEY